MVEMNITIQRTNDMLRLLEGVPDQLGISGASLYVSFIYTKTQVSVWTTDPLTSYERRMVSHALLHLVQSKDEPEIYRSETAEYQQ